MSSSVLMEQDYVDATNGNDGNEKVGQSWDTAYQTLATAVATAISGDTIMLSAGEYTLYGIKSDNTTKGKDLTFIGAGVENTTWIIGAEVPDPSKSGTEYNSDYSFQGASVTFKDMTLNSYYSKADTNKSGYENYLGFSHTVNTLVDSCVINGVTAYWGYTSAEFRNTTFNAPAGGYALWSYSSATMTFDNCTFNSSGKVVNVYNEGYTGNVVVNFKDCTINNSIGTSEKAVLNINDRYVGGFTINISGNNSAYGITADNMTCSRLFGFGGTEKNPAYIEGVPYYNNNGRTEVTINGVKVWENGKRAVAHDYAGFSTGSYDDGINANDTQYTDGYKDDAFTVTWGAWYAGRDGKLHRTGTCTCNYCGYSEDINDEKDFELDVSRSKTATDLDSNYRSTVTLSLPSAKEKLASDIVFVLDTSDCVGNVMKNVSKLVTQLETAQKDTGANIKVGVVAFKGSALPMFDGKLVSVETAKTTLAEMANEVSDAKDTSAKEAVVLKYLNADKADKEFINKGSNLHSGLLGAQALLEADTAVDNNRKYVITVTDGMTYYWNDSEGNVYGVYSEPNNDYPNLLFYAWCQANHVDSNNNYALPSTGFSWTEYLTSANSKVKSDNYSVDLRKTAKRLNKAPNAIRFPGISAADFRTNYSDIPFIPVADITKYAHGVDYSVIACLNTYQEMVDAKYQCYTVNAKYDTNTFPGLFTSELNEMAHKTVVDFDSIQNDILYAVGKGSTVVDKMGGEFDFVPGSLKLTVGGKKLDAKTVGNVTYFGDDAKTLSESNYRFKVEYDSDEDMFTWTINENVSNFAPVQLSYQVQLVHPKTVPGTYKVPTNEYAKLTPVDSLGNQGKELTFPVPEVSYTVRRHSTTGVTKPALNTADHYAYVMGYPDGTVQPGGYITRAEASTIFFRLLTDETREQYWATTNAYSDIKSGDWYNNAISTLSNAGIVSGYPDGTFRPNAPITRAEMSKIIALFAKLDKTTDRFSDIAGHWAEAYIKLAAGNGWIEGYPDGTFKPQQNITRAETVTMINRVLERVPSEEDHLLSERVMLTFPDCKSGDWFYIAVQEATNSHTYERAVTEKNGDEQWTALRANRDWTLLEK